MQSADNHRPVVCQWIATILLTLTLWHAGAGLACAQGQDQPEAPATDMFTHLISSAGIFFGPLLLLVSIGLVTLIVLLAMDLRMGVAIPPGFVAELAETVNK